MPISGDISTTGNTLTGHYIFSDLDGDGEGTSTYQWYKNGTPISPATSITYMTQSGDNGAIITFEVTPVDEHGASGTPETSTGVTIGET